MLDFIKILSTKKYLIPLRCKEFMSHSSHDMPHPSHEKTSFHGFLMLGTKTLYLCHLPMYHTQEHSYQTILKAEIEESHMKNYINLKKENPAKPIIILNKKDMLLKDLVNSSSYIGEIKFANENGDPIGEPLISGEITINIKKILLFRQLNRNSPDYPENLQYYLFGSDSDWHLSHYLSKAPNFEQELDISISGNLSDKIKESEIIKISISSLKEKKIQPITKDPLTKNDYSIVTENGDKFQISILNRFWINNIPLNH